MFIKFKCYILLFSYNKPFTHLHDEVLAISLATDPVVVSTLHTSRAIQLGSLPSSDALGILAVTLSILKHGLFGGITSFMVIEDNDIGVGVGPICDDITVM